MRSTGMNFKSSSSRRGTQLLQKSNTNISINTLQKKLSIGGPNNRLKQQKTQLHPNLVSIIEEEETFSDDDEDSDDSDLQINDDEDENLDDSDSEEDD